ncbi:substrate-binding periplasmic protein [Kiloniella laminariae]|uniref:substrate-binding periplasmic protein n=1 Tax=Kiloniella laminariae TaxID=454162 RepID=UPI0003634B64|nr:transporter substrate-binding domain-containing protein [Kiloniella laminariae]
MFKRTLQSLTFCIVFLGWLVSTAFCASALEFYTEDFPPYNYVEDGKLKGIGPKIVRELMAEVGESPDIIVLPWVRAYKYAQERSNSAIFSIVRTPNRESEFQWVGPLYTVRVGLYAAGENRQLYSHDNDANLAQAMKTGNIAVQLGGAGEELLTSRGFKNLNPVLNVEKSLFLLLKGRYDLLETSDVFMAYAIEKEGLAVEAASEAVLIGQYDMYLAFSNNTPAAVVQKWQDALDRLRKRTASPDLS